jgi:hypothetical protein
MTVLRFRISRRLCIIFGLVCLVLGSAGGTAFAAWTSLGSGSGTGSTGALAPVTVVAMVGGDTPTTALLPGGSSDVVLRVDNTNAYAVTLTAITQNTPITMVGNVGTCTTTGLSINFPSTPSITVPVGSTLVHVPGAASMSTASMNGCQGASFEFPVTVTFQKG